MIVNGTTNTGLSFAIDADVVKDVRFSRAIRKLRMGEKNPDAVLDGLYEMQTLFFPEGSEGEAALFEHVRTAGGYVTNEAVDAEITDILHALEAAGGEVKK